MDPQIIEIIDTTVKIGLGAIISGLSAYLLSKANFSHEKQAKASERRVKLLEEIALKIEAAKFKLDEACHPFWHQVVDGDQSDRRKNVKDSIDSLLEAVSFAGHAKAHSLLLGEQELADKIATSEKEIAQIYAMISKDAFKNSAEVNAPFGEIEKGFNHSYKILAKAYKNY